MARHRRADERVQEWVEAHQLKVVARVSVSTVRETQLGPITNIQHRWVAVTDHPPERYWSMGYLDAYPGSCQYDIARDIIRAER